MLLFWRQITLYSFHGCIHNKFAIDMHLNECIRSSIFKNRNYFRLVDWKCATETPNAEQISMFFFTYFASLAMRTQVNRTIFFESPPDAQQILKCCLQNSFDCVAIFASINPMSALHIVTYPSWWNTWVEIAWFFTELVASMLSVLI